MAATGAGKVRAGANPDRYLALVKRHPLISIRSKKDFDEAQAVVDGLLREELDNGKQAYLDVLSDLMIVYEQEHHAVAPLAPNELLPRCWRSGACRKQSWRERPVLPGLQSAIWRPASAHSRSSKCTRWPASLGCRAPCFCRKPQVNNRSGATVRFRYALPARFLAGLTRTARARPRKRHSSSPTWKRRLPDEPLPRPELASKVTASS